MAVLIEKEKRRGKETTSYVGEQPPLVLVSSSSFFREMRYPRQVNKFLTKKAHFVFSFQNKTKKKFPKSQA